MPNAKKSRSPSYDAFVVRYLKRHDDVAEGSLFGMPCLKAGTKAFAGSFDGGLALKLGDGAEKALTIDGSAPFDPSGKGRPMKGWVVVPASAKRRWTKLADDARGIVLEG